MECHILFSLYFSTKIEIHVCWCTFNVEVKITNIDYAIRIVYENEEMKSIRMKQQSTVLQNQNDRKVENFLL